MGLGEKKIVAKGNNINDVAEETIEKLMTDEVSKISLFVQKYQNLSQNILP